MSDDLKINTKDKFDNLINYIYNTVTIKYVYIVKDNKKIKYYNRKNQWNEKGYTNDGECNGYFECDLDDHIYTNEKIHYVFNYVPNLNFNYGKEIALDDKEVKILSENKLNDIYLKCCDTIILNNLDGYNEDHRGADHTKLMLDFHRQIILKPTDNKIYFKDFVDACFRIKSHKFDPWYEMYCGVNCIKKNNKINVSVRFDHGS
jgi:hypothetical protein